MVYSDIGRVKAYQKVSDITIDILSGSDQWI